MKHILLSSASALTLLVCASAATAAPAQVSGYVGLNVGADWTDFDVNSSTYGTNDTVFVFGGDAHINAWLDHDMSLQFDVQTEATTSIQTRQDGSNDHDGRVGGIIGAHLSWRDPKSYLIGFFGGFSGESNIDYDGTFTNAIMGVEGQWYCDQWTFYGQAGYAPLMSDSNYDEFDHLWFVRGVVRYFFTDNDRIQADVSYGRSDMMGDSYHDRAWNAGLSWQHRFSNSPFSTTIAYNGMWASSDGFSPDNNASENQLTVAFNIHFGDSSLMQADRDGATLDMPNFNRAGAWAYWLDY